MAQAELESRINPHTDMTLDESRKRRLQKLERVAYYIQESKILKAKTDPYEREILSKVDPEEIARRNYHLAQIWVDSGDRYTLQKFGHDLARLKARSRL